MDNFDAKISELVESNNTNAETLATVMHAVAVQSIKIGVLLDLLKEKTDVTDEEFSCRCAARHEEIKSVSLEKEREEATKDVPNVTMFKGTMN